jgi:hypothetical protein
VNRTIVSFLAAAGLGMALAAQPATARDLPTGGMTAQEVAAWLTAGGYSAAVKPDPTTPGDQIISSTINGVDYDIYMYACTAGRCKSLQYAAGWPVSAAGSVDVATKIMAWDRENRFLRAYISGSGQNFWGELDIDISPGGTYEGLDRSLARWSAVVGSFKTYMVP